MAGHGSRWLRAIRRVCALTLIALGAIPFVAGCGGDDEGTSDETEHAGGSSMASSTSTSTTAAETKAADECREVSTHNVADATGVKAEVRAAVALKTDIPGGPLDLPQNKPNYYVAVETRSGVAVFAMDGEALTGKSGLVYGADNRARELSIAGVDVDVAEYGIGPGDPDYDAVKACL